jgi:hypothetical protein
MMEISVVNRHHQKPEDEKGEYIGRGTPLGNPWQVNAEYTRERAIAQYEVWLNRQIQVEDPDVMRELNRLIDIAEIRPLKLVCSCKPLACHGDIVKKILLSCVEVSE